MTDDFKIRELAADRFWDYENGYWWFGDPDRFAKSLAQAEIYQEVLGLPGTVAEFGVYKANSLIRWLTIRDLYESVSSRSVLGFDAFGAFPQEKLNKVKSDRTSVKKFIDEGGDGLSVDEVDRVLNRKGFKNYELIQGNVFETLPVFLERRAHEQFALINLDMDVYEPTRFVLEQLFERVVSGGLIVIDDFNTVAGATQAVNELLRKKLDG